MALNHYKWESNGRTLYNVSAGQYMYTSTVGEENTPTGSTYFPYILSGGQIQFGNLLDKIEFATDKQVLKRLADIICSSFKLYVEAFIGGSWTSQPHGGDPPQALRRPLRLRSYTPPSEHGASPNRLLRRELPEQTHRGSCSPPVPSVACS